jgi:hypothetical protein
MQLISSMASMEVMGHLRFPKPQDAIPDTIFINPRVTHRRWSRNLSFEEHDDVNMDDVEVVVRDMRNSSVEFRLLDNGFEFVKLRPTILPFLHNILEQGLDGGRQGVQWGLDEESAESSLANALEGIGAFQLHNMWHYNVKCAGFVMRAGNPLGKKSQPGTTSRARFDMVAQRVHIDQDLDGEPLQSMGVAGLLQMPFVELFNVWVPLLTSPIRPLAFADTRTVADEHLLRYRANSTQNAGGRNGSFSSDRMMALHHHAQEWWYHSGVEFGDAAIFSTGRTAHSSFSLPGEHVLNEHLARFQGMREILLQQAEKHGKEWAAELSQDVAEMAYKKVCGAKAHRLDTARDTAGVDPRVAHLAALLDTESEAWCTRILPAIATPPSAESAEAKQHRREMVLELSELIERALTRKSLEIRCVALVASVSPAALSRAAIALAAVLTTAVLLRGCYDGP